MIDKNQDNLLDGVRFRTGEKLDIGGKRSESWSTESWKSPIALWSETFIAALLDTPDAAPG